MPALDLTTSLRGDLPRHIKCKWIRGECIRYLRICSEQSFFRVCRMRLDLTTSLRGDLPRHIKCKWIRGECIRYLRICSEQSFFRVCRMRLVSALSFLDYPESVIRSNLLTWEDRDRVLVPRCQRVPDQSVPVSSTSLSQCEQSIDGVEHGGGGWVGIPHVHVLRAWHHSAVPVSWPRVVHCLTRRLPFLQHSAKLYAILRPLTSVKRFFRTAAHAALQSR